MNSPYIHSIASLADRVEQMNHSSRIIISIVGRPAAGKSLISQAVARQLNARGIASVVLPMDGFHMTSHKLTSLGLLHAKGAPETFEAHAFVDSVKALSSADGSVLWPLYSRTAHDPVPDAVTVPAGRQVILLEGNYVTLPTEPWSGLGQYVTESWYIDTDKDDTHSRLVRRHLAEGMTHEEAVNHATTIDLPNGDLVAATKDSCTVVVRIAKYDPDLQSIEDTSTNTTFVLE